MALHEGDIVGNYIIREQLGQGGMATVFKGYHEALDRYVAIKVMHQNFLDDETFIARFRREAQIVARLTHPHIVPVFDFGQHERLPYLVMKYVKGETLKQHLNRQALELSEILTIIKAVGGALTYAHQQDVLHRDIKPSNIVLDTHETPYITDFGLARLASSGESTMSADMLLGTPHYISPEQAQGMTDIDGRADIYSLGVVLYELLVGHVPYTADTPYAIIHDHIYRPLPAPTDINPEIPQAVEMVLYRALDKNRDNRYSTANEMVQDLEDAIEEANLTSLRPDRFEVAATSIARKRADYAKTVNLSTTPTASALGAQSVRLSDIKQKRQVWHENPRFWQTSGCASFLIITFISFGVLLNVWSNITELNALNIGSNISVEINDENVRVFVPTFDALNIIYDADNARIVIPNDITVQDAVRILDNQRNESLSYLVAASVVWDDDIETARQHIFEGFQYTTRDNRAVYFNSAAALADDIGDVESALIFSIIALESAAQDDGEDSATVRNISGQYLYEHIADVQEFGLHDLTMLIRSIDTGSAFDFDATDSIAARFAVSKQLIESENYIPARTLIARENNSDNSLRAEFALLSAEINIAQDNLDTAETTLNGILDAEIPPWLRARVTELLNDLRN